jgi:hypothetical protein
MVPEIYYESDIESSDNKIDDDFIVVDHKGEGTWFKMLVCPGFIASIFLLFMCI